MIKEKERKSGLLLPPSESAKKIEEVKHLLASGKEIRFK